MNKKLDVRKIVTSALIAAIYATVTYAIAPLSYGDVQFRISEILVLLAFIDPYYIVGLTLGCFIANIFGPNGMLDIIFGTFATFLSVSAISLTGKLMKDKKYGLFIASLWPVLFNGLIIGMMLHYTINLPLFLTIGQVALGELVVISIVGVPVFKFIQKKYGKILKTI